MGSCGIATAGGRTRGGGRITVHSRSPASDDKLVVLAVLAAILAPLGAVSAQTGGGAPDPAGNVDAPHKFDAGFYAKIRGLIAEDPQDGNPGARDGTRHYSVIIVVSRDDGDARGPEETARENKGAVAKRLELVGARDIAPAGSLSFVTASVPVADIPGLSLHDEVYRLGDGELPAVPAVDTARQTTHAAPDDIRSAAGRSLDGSGVVVGVLDSGIYHDTAFAGRILGHVACNDTGCNSASAPSSNVATHGTQVAQVLAASGLPMHNGTATGVEILDIDVINNPGTTRGSALVAHALDYALINGADVVNMSFGFARANGGVFCNSSGSNTNTYDLIINEAVDKGMVVVGVAGNSGGPYPRQITYESIPTPHCGSNVITVGGINDRNPSTTRMYGDAGRGPVGGTVILKPEMVAPAEDIEMLRFTNSPNTHLGSGTSLAAPQVSAAAALMLQLKPDLTPSEIKAGLLLGADWQGPVPCTSGQYEQNRPNDNCSYARQEGNVNLANNAASLGILNNVGFGILDAAQSLEYVGGASRHVISDHLDANTTSRQHVIHVSGTQQTMKVILTWMAHPHGGTIDLEDRSRTQVRVADLDFVVTRHDGTVVARAESAHQTNEFAVFAPTSGTYTVNVTGSGLNQPVQTYALASTHAFHSHTFTSGNSPPTAPNTQAAVLEDAVETITPAISDPDAGDTPRISAVDDPPNGSASFTETTITYTPDRDYDGTDTFGYTVTDGRDTAQGTVTVTVTRDNNAPVLGTIGDQAATAGTLLDIVPTVTDADPTDTHTYSISRGTLPAEAAFTDADGSLAWTPAPADAGSTHTVTITVDDGRGGTDSETFDIAVGAAPDTSAPVITLIGADPLAHELGDAYADPGATADDGSAVVTDGSAVDVNVAGDYTVTYTATDREGNEGTAARTVQVRDTSAPVITLAGDQSITLELGSSYAEQGASVSDNDPAYAVTEATVGGDTVDVSVTGVYVVTYTAPADGAGNAPCPVSRTVTVQAPPYNPTPRPPCAPPSSGHWDIRDSCALASDVSVPAGITIHAPATLVIPAGVTLDVDLAGHGLLVKAGAGLLIQHGGGMK